MLLTQAKTNLEEARNNLHVAWILTIARSTTVAAATAAAAAPNITCSRIAEMGETISQFGYDT